MYRSTKPRGPLTLTWHAAKTWPFWAAITPALYVAGFGPLCGAAARGYVPLRALRTFYAPLLAIAFDPLDGQANAVGEAMFWWATICGGKDTFFGSIPLF